MALQNLFNLGSGTDIEIKLENEDKRKIFEYKGEDGRTNKIPIFYDGETLSGLVQINIKRGSKLENKGVRISFVGHIELHGDRNNREEFINLQKDLARPGVLSQNISYPFEFTQVDKPHESYNGQIVRLRYFLKLTVVKKLRNINREKDVFVHSLSKYPDNDPSIKMEVGIEESLHIEFEYNKSKYHLNDIIVGKIYFHLVRVKIKNMEIQILRRESAGLGINAINETDIIAKYEIMDGAPVRGESIPIRLFLAQYPLTPTMPDVNRKFSVRYLLNLVLLDEENRRYYKSQEIILYRKCDKKRKIYATSKVIALKKLQISGEDVDAELMKELSEDKDTKSGSQECSISSGKQVNLDHMTRDERSMHRFESKTEETTQIPSHSETLNRMADGDSFKPTQPAPTPRLEMEREDPDKNNNSNNNNCQDSAGNSTSTAEDASIKSDQLPAPQTNGHADSPPRPATPQDESAPEEHVSPKSTTQSEATPVTPSEQENQPPPPAVQNRSEDVFADC